MSFRKEKKIKLTVFEYQLIKNLLLQEGMQQLHKKRNIHSLYYDTALYSMFHDSEEGLLPRKKVRIRWYENIKKANTEVKISSVEGRFKTISFANIISEAAFPEMLVDSQYGAVVPSLLVSYTREYFSFESMRLTFDSHIKYTDYRQSKTRQYEDSERVMEVKVGAEVPDDYIEKKLPYPTTRFSKYSRGLLIAFGDL